MNNRKLLFLDFSIGILAGFMLYSFSVGMLNFNSSDGIMSAFGPIITLIGLVVFRVGIYFHYKNKI